MQADPKAKENWSFHADDGSSVAEGTSRPSHHHEPVSWTGSEFIAEHKNPSWYLGLATFIAAICVLIFVISKQDYLSIAFVAIIGLLFGIIASRKPRQLNYLIDDQGITIGPKHYPFGMFKSFSLNHDGAIGYISLLPLQRLRAELSIYFAPEDETKIREALVSYLPQENRAESQIDHLMRRIRF